LQCFRRNGGQEGITLIELAVVMAIVAIMGAFMAPSIGEWVANYRIRQTARDIASTFQDAKMRAIAKRQAYSVTLTSNLDPAANDDYQMSTAPADPNIPPQQTTARGVKITPVGTVVTFTFNPDGTSNGGSITITNTQGRTYTVGVMATGRIGIN
jgi:prepilin-type N-terminal cleavage/methylation domain-containing protein